MRIQKVLSEGVNSNVFYFFFMLMRGGQRILITLKVGHHQPTSETPVKWHFASGPMIKPEKECWLGSFVIFWGA